MKILFWTLCGLIAWSYLLYPAVLWMLALAGARRYRKDASFEPTMSMLIPAYNEEQVIGAKLDNALALDYPPGKLEILVASESDDGTNAVVEARAARSGGRVKLVASPHRRGKVANLIGAVPRATGEILVFTDANAMCRPDALRKLVRNFADPRVGSVSGRLVLEVPGASPAGAGEGAYWSVEMMVKRASSALGSLPGANGSLFALRREAFRPISGRRGDDFELPVRAIIDGRASILETEAISVERASGGYLDEFRRKVRIINWMIRSALILLREAVAARRWLLAFQLLSHKLNRWACAVWLLALLPASLLLAGEGGIYLGVLAGQLLIYTLAVCGLLLAAAGLGVPKLLGLPLYFVVVNSASLIGILTCAAGREVRWHKRRDGVS